MRYVYSNGIRKRRILPREAHSPVVLCSLGPLACPEAHLLQGGRAVLPGPSILVGPRGQGVQAVPARSKSKYQPLKIQSANSGVNSTTISIRPTKLGGCQVTQGAKLCIVHPQNANLLTSIYLEKLWECLPRSKSIHKVKIVKVVARKRTLLVQVL
jgi:hypothetical protein